MSRRVVTGKLAAVVRERRQARGLTQEELAAQVGVTQAYVSSMEMGRVQLPNRAVRRRLARSLGMGHLELLVAVGELEVWEVPSPSATPPEQLGLNERIRAALAVMVEDEVGSYLGDGRSSSLRAERKRASES